MPKIEDNAETPSSSFVEMTPDEAVAYDFFKDEKLEEVKEPSEEAPKETATEQAPEIEAAPKVEEEPKVEEPPVEAPVPVHVPDQSAELLELRRQNQLLTEAVSRATKATEVERPKAAPVEPIFGMQVPDELIEAMGHEDPRIRRNATQMLINGAADVVYRKAMADLRQEYQQVFQNGIQQHSQTMSQRDAVASDFYGNYPEFDKPNLRKIVTLVADDVSRELGATAWSPQLRDAIGAKLREIFGASASPPTQKLPAQGRRATPKAINPGTRPTPPSSGQESLEDFLGLNSL